MKACELQNNFFGVRGSKLFILSGRDARGLATLPFREQEFRALGVVGQLISISFWISFSFLLEGGRAMINASPLLEVDGEYGLRKCCML